MAPYIAPGMARLHETRAEQLTRESLNVLGYADRINMADPKQFALVKACEASVSKAVR
jgi:hypothetical protein